MTSARILEFIPERQLEHELATRDADSLRSLMNDLMSLADRIGYDPEQDMAAAPLNLTSKSFNTGMPTPAPLRDFEREPGPFSVHRYLFPKSGVPTFGGAPVAIWPEDLVAGKVDVAIVGVPSNMSSGRRDAVNGPDEMRGLNTIAVPDVQTLVKPFETLSVVDYGDFAVDRMSTERTVSHVTAMVAETAGTGAIPMLVGGDTSMLYPAVSGVARVHGKGSFGLLHFSAHPDADTLQWLRDKHVRYHTMAEFRERGSESVMDRVRQEVESGPGAYFVSVDVSVVKPAEMVAAGRATYDGLRPEEVTQAIRHLWAAEGV